MGDQEKVRDLCRLMLKTPKIRMAIAGQHWHKLDGKAEWEALKAHPHLEDLKPKLVTLAVHLQDFEPKEIPTWLKEKFGFKPGQLLVPWDIFWEWGEVIAES